ncbi:transposase [Patescibacteria group bacterium]
MRKLKKEAARAPRLLYSSLGAKDSSLGVRDSSLGVRDSSLGAKDSSLGAPPDALVKIIAYALLPNHFHFLLRQIKEGGISKFMQKVGQGCTNYFNRRYDRVGSLFQGPYQSVPVKTESYWLKISCYINGNPEIHGLVKRAQDWDYSSYRDYLSMRNGTLCDKQVILKDFGNLQEYKKLTDYTIKESRELKFEIRKYCLE